MKRLHNLNGQDNFIMLINKTQKPEYLGSRDKQKLDAQSNYGNPKGLRDSMEEIDNDAQEENDQKK